VDQLASLRELVKDMEGRLGENTAHAGRKPVYTAPVDFGFANS